MEEARRIPMPLMDRHEEEAPITHVDVINHNKDGFWDRFNNEKIEFPAHERVTISLDAARHIFGIDLPEEDRVRHVCRRFGWNTPVHMENNRYMELYRNLDIVPARFRLVRVNDEKPVLEKRTAGRPKTKYKPPSLDDLDPDPVA